MKIIKTIVVLAVLSGAALFGAKLYTQNQSDELSGTIDQLNPLVDKGEVYVKTKKADSVNGYGITTYKQPTFDKDGKKKNLTFTADHELITDRYLKIYNKGAHVETYEEVSKEDVPEKALEELNK
ncbi:YxeA family protein [Enterococcus sp. AZ126]|uniref:YxeA family protein n=1 Tax=Enterococcus sp. AZ126 TaxID=2774635 RepID=UPI003F23A7CC